MPWIIKTVTRLPVDAEERIEYFGSGETDEAKALDRVRSYAPQAQVSIVRDLTDAELSTYGVPQGRTQMIRFDEGQTAA